MEPFSKEAILVKNLTVVILATLLLSTSAQGAAVDLGTVDQPPPTKKELMAPKNDEGVAVVGLRVNLQGKVPKNDKRNLYVIVNPLSNPDTVNTWWVQEVVERSEDSIQAVAQLGENNVGQGEYFAILAVSTDKKWSVGEMIYGLPDDARFTRLRIVKRR